MPCAVVARPRSRARARLSELGSIPTIHTGCSHSLRRVLYIRSVPIFPEPISAALIFAMETSVPRPRAAGPPLNEELLHVLAHIQRPERGADDARVVGHVGARGV